MKTPGIGLLLLAACGLLAQADEVSDPPSSQPVGTSVAAVEQAGTTLHDSVRKILDLSRSTRSTNGNPFVESPQEPTEATMEEPPLAEPPLAEPELAEPAPVEPPLAEPVPAEAAPGPMPELAEEPEPTEIPSKASMLRFRVSRLREILAKQRKSSAEENEVEAVELPADDSAQPLQPIEVKEEAQPLRPSEERDGSAPQLIPAEPNAEEKSEEAPAEEKTSDPQQPEPKAVESEANPQDAPRILLPDQLGPLEAIPGPAGTKPEQPGEEPKPAEQAQPKPEETKQLRPLQPDEQMQPIHKKPHRRTPPPVPRPSQRNVQTFSTEMLRLRNQMRQVVGYYQQQKLNTVEHNPWEVMHAIIGAGVKAELHYASPRGQLINAIAYQCYNGPCRGERLLYLNRYGVHARKGPRVQGHYGQFLAILAQAGVSKNYPMKVQGRPFTIANLIESEKQTCQRDMELTFKLLALSYYLDDTDETWATRQAGRWNLQGLIAEELDAPILRDAACGGTHRLMGLSYAIHRRKLEGKPMQGQFWRAKKYIEDYQDYTLRLQNSDGSFSTEWFRRRADNPSIDRRVQTTGHILEWLVYSLPESELQDPRVVKAVSYLSDLLWQQRSHEWEIGPLNHAVHALRLYDRRVFTKAELAAKSSDRKAGYSSLRTQPRSMEEVRYLLNEFYFNP